MMDEGRREFIINQHVLESKYHINYFQEVRMPKNTALELKSQLNLSSITSYCDEKSLSVIFIKRHTNISIIPNQYTVRSFSELLSQRIMDAVIKIETKRI